MSINCFLISFLLGLFLADSLIYNIAIQKTLWIMFGLLFLILVFWRKDKIVKIMTLCSLGLLLGLLYFQFLRQKPFPEYISYYNNQTITLQGVVAEEPIRSGQKTKLVIQINGIKGKVLVNTSLFPTYNFGDILKIRGKLEEPPVFDEFNYRNYLKASGIYSIINKPQIEKVETIRGFSLKKSLFDIKNHLEGALNKILPEPEASLANGLLFGERTNLPNDLIEAFIAAGIIHIIALSGYNISIISKNLSILFNYLMPRFAFYLPLAAIWLFVIMVGAKASIVRAALFGSMYLIAKKIGRRRDMSRALLLTACLMALPNPLILKYDSGFQLSFLATASLLYLAPILENRVLQWQLPPWAKEAIIATTSAQLFVLPLLILNFKRISAVAPVANVLILPIIPYAMFFVFIAALFSLLYFPLGQFLGWFAFLFLRYIIFVAKFTSKIPGSYWEVKKTNVLIGFIYWLVLIIVVYKINSLKGKQKNGSA